MTFERLSGDLILVYQPGTRHDISPSRVQVLFHLLYCFTIPLQLRIVFKSLICLLLCFSSTFSWDLCYLSGVISPFLVDPVDFNLKSIGTPILLDIRVLNTILCSESLSPPLEINFNVFLLTLANFISRVLYVFNQF